MRIFLALLANFAEEKHDDVHIVLHLENIKLPEGQEVLLKDIDTDRPKLELPDGTVLEGEFEETLGTQMIFRTETSQGEVPREQYISVWIVLLLLSDEGKGKPIKAGAQRAGDESSVPEPEPTESVRLLCHTDKKITFRKKK